MLRSPEVGGVAGPPDPEEDAEAEVEVEEDVSRECDKAAAEEEEAPVMGETGEMGVEMSIAPGRGEPFGGLEGRV